MPPRLALRGSPPVSNPAPKAAESVGRGLLGRAEGFLYTLADAAVSSTSDSVTTAKQSDDWLSGIANYMESVLKVLKDGLSALHVPYAYGFAIIMLTVLVKAATYPLTKKQVESAMAMRSLQPQVKAIQQRFAGDQERIQLETARLYKLASINPLAGCLPTLATIPVWIGLYRALSNVADEGLLTEGFFWIPSLSGPTTIAARQSGSGISWLFPFVDGHPPLGWSDTLAYLVLPVLLVISQYISVQIMQSAQSNDPNMKSSQAVTKFLPLMIGYFALSVPSGLSLYWLTNNILSTAQQVWLQKLGGAKIQVKQFSTDVIKEEQPRVEKSIPDLTNTQKDTRQGEKLIAEGLRPGERFKQIKEEEARRRRQREEEKRKAEEAAAKASQIPNERNERENEGGLDLNVEKNDTNHSENSIHNSSSSEVAVNGNMPRVDLKESENTTSTLDNEVSTSLEVDVREEEQSYERLRKDRIKSEQILGFSYIGKDFFLPTMAHVESVLERSQLFSHKAVNFYCCGQRFSLMIVDECLKKSGGSGGGGQSDKSGGGGGAVGEEWGEGGCRRHRFGVIYSDAVSGTADVGEVVEHERLVDDCFFLICKGQEEDTRSCRRWSRGSLVG
ncbi:ALBINO3-like protein 1 [Morus notabilis]|uniref:ALBINO3-like protein 1 n=1 Tax=Morus notabilis TaxID=981085 RepID=W9RCC4_9ROSA|nr:ALBINO3-like protein 1 [Morus notabilis]